MSVLEQLAPLQYPPKPAWWPPAPGWWLLGLLVLALLLLLWRQRRWIIDYWIRLETTAPSTEAPSLEPVRQAALEQLASLRRPADGEPAGPWLQDMNALLKRLCRNRYPESASHRLSGRAWLAFLDSRCPAAGLTRWMILVEGSYRSDCRLDYKSINGLYQAVETWIRKHA